MPAKRRVQFTSAEFTNRLKAAAIRINWDGRGRALDNVFVERLWHSVKYEAEKVEWASAVKQIFFTSGSSKP